MTLRDIILKVTDNNSLDIYLSQYNELDREISICLNDSDSSTEMPIQELVSAEKIYLVVGRPFH